MKPYGMIAAGVCLLLVHSGCGTLKSDCRLDWQSPYRNISALREGDIVHLPTGVLVSKDELIDVSDGARIIYVGETHDNLNAHKVQLEILRAFHDRHPGDIAVGVEMLRRPSQVIADQWASGLLDKKTFVRAWNTDWTNDYAYYEDIMEFVREQRIPLLALRASDEWINRIKGLEDTDNTGLEEEQLETLPEMDIEDTYHRSHIEALFNQHPGHRQRDFETFYNVQVLWDESMAQSIYDYLISENGRGKKILVFAGSQHVEHGFGIPRRVFRRIPSPYVIVLPVMVEAPARKKHKSMRVTLPQVPLLPGDFAWIVTHKDLEDKRVYLGVMIKETDEGIQIIGIAKGSAAEKAGLEKEDIITTFDGEPIEASFDLTYLIGLKEPGEKGIVEVCRNGETLRYDVTFEARGLEE
jgi:uncharacterized iron-regulated protein